MKTKFKAINNNIFEINKLIKKYPKLKDLEQLDDAAIKVVLKVIHNKLQKDKIKQKFQSRISLSGKYKSVRNLIETLLDNNPKLTMTEAIKAVEVEYPNSAFMQDAYRQFAYYKSVILKGGAWLTITPTDVKQREKMEYFKRH